MTPKQEAALRLALDCVSTLANARDWVGCTPNERWDEDEMYAELCNATICLKKSLSIIQEALAEQPAQEPVAWVCYGATVNHHDIDFDQNEIDAIPLGTMLYTSPQPSKPWVGLTQQDINIAFDDTQEGGGFDDFARAIETKLREKNAPQQSKEDA